MVEEQAPLFPTKEQEQLYNKFKYYYKHYWGVDRVEVLKRLINTKEKYAERLLHIIQYQKTLEILIRVWC